jgi:small subunit ribosomal protein S13
VPKEEEFKYIVRIAGTDIDGNKKVPYGLTKIRGIGLRMGEVLCNIAGVDPSKKVGYLTDEEAGRLDEAIKHLQDKGVPGWLFNRRGDYSTGKDLHRIGSDLMMALREDISRMRKIRSYRGIRHELGLPVRGQRTRTSFRRGTTVGVKRGKLRRMEKREKGTEKKR